MNTLRNYLYSRRVRKFKFDSINTRGYMIFIFSVTILPVVICLLSLPFAFFVSNILFLVTLLSGMFIIGGLTAWPELPKVLRWREEE